jgi:hypothetical protein
MVELSMQTCSRYLQAVFVATLMLFCGVCVAQDDEKTLQMVRTETAPVIDGVMDDVWETAAVVDDLHQMKPTEYSEPSERTVFKVLYDDDYIYVSAMMYYSDPSEITANKLIQGASLGNEDKLRVYINPFNDGRNGYMFQTNANGIRKQAIVQNVTDLNFAWNGIWQSDAKRTEYGWFGEIAIPFKTISFDPNSDRWGISFLRSIEGRSEEMVWTSYNRSVNPSNYGTALGISGIQQGVGLDIIPSVSFADSRTYGPSSSESDIEPSLDVFYKFTPNLTGALTINSDFSATEVDSRQVQLSRFNLFFPEQRKFFLQEADIFEFGGLDDNGKPFFSRRIGIGPGGQQLDLEAGGKVTGRIGRWNVGALAVKQSGNEGDVPLGGQLVDDSELFVGRVAANVFGQSTIGAIATQGNPTGDADNSLVGVDFNYLNTRSFDNITLEGQLWYQQSDTDGLEGDDESWGIKLRSPNAVGFRWRTSYTDIGEDFFPALGFVNRTGIRRGTAAVAYIHRFAPGSAILSLTNFLDYQRITDSDGKLESEFTQLIFGEIETRSGDEIFLLANDNREVLTSPFTISEGITIPIGDYSYQRYGAEFSTGGQRQVIATVHLEDGGFFSGDRFTANVELAWQPSKHFTAVLEYEYNDIDLLEGSFEARLMRLRTEVAFNAEWAWLTTTQYDNQSEALGVNSRLQWIPKAGQEYYLIYNGGWREDIMSNFDPVGRSITLKVSHTFRF